jgi:hypothetical protein
MPEGENLQFELEMRGNGGPKSGKQSDEQGQHPVRERYQPLAQICNGGKRFRVSVRDCSVIDDCVFYGLRVVAPERSPERCPRACELYSIRVQLYST